MFRSPHVAALGHRGALRQVQRDRQHSGMTQTCAPPLGFMLGPFVCQERG